MNPLKNLKILNSKQKKPIIKLIKEKYGVEFPKESVLIENKDNKIFLSTNFNVDLNKLRVNSIGLYIGKLENSDFRLSIEGSQIIKPKKNVLEINKKQLTLWMQGENIETSKEFNGFVAIKHNKDFLGSGKYKENKILNYVPKERRLP